MKRIALIEPNHSHEEVLFPLIELLHGIYDVHVVAPQTLLDVDLLKDTRHLYQGAAYTPALPRHRIKRTLGIWQKYVAIRRVVDQIKPELVIFNSVQTRVDECCIAWVFRNYPKIRMIHNFQNCLSPLGRLLYSVFNGNLVISEQVYRYVTTQHPHVNKLSYVLPIFFSGFRDSAPAHLPTLNSTDECVKLGVFGSIEQARRNYRGLLDALSKWAGQGESTPFHVHLAGKAPAWLRAEIQQHNLQQIVTIYDQFIPFREMFNLFDEMDVVLFLIDDSVANARHYNRYKISGTSTLLKAFPKVCASSTDFDLDDTLQAGSYFYDGQDIQGLLERIAQGKITHSTIQAKLAATPPAAEFSFERQQAKLIEMIEKVTMRP